MKFFIFLLVTSILTVSLLLLISSVIISNIEISEEKYLTVERISKSNPLVRPLILEALSDNKIMIPEYKKIISDTKYKSSDIIKRIRENLAD